MSSARRIAGLIAATGLAGAGALHGAWALGATFPAHSPDDLADLVVGTAGPPPGPFPSASVAVGLAGAAAAVSLTALAAGPPVLQRWSRRASVALAGVLGARGVGGLVLDAVGSERASARFRRWDARVYSPLCLALAGGTVAALAAGRQSNTTVRLA